VLTLIALAMGPASASAERVVVRFDDDTSARSRAHARASVNGDLEFTIGRYQVLDVDDADTAVRSLRGDVAEAFEDPEVRAATAVTKPNDPRFDDQWGLHNFGQWVLFDAPEGLPGADVNALEAWRWSKGAGSPPLAVIDSGVDFTHPDLAGAEWTNPDEIAGNGIDDDNNGFVDDVTGWDFKRQSGDTPDLHGHGTGVSGIAAARANNGIGIAGIAPEAKIMDLRVLDEDGYGNASDVSEAILYAARNGARVANISLAFKEDASEVLLEEAIRQVPNLLIVAGAGNDSADNDTAPEAVRPCRSSAPNVICVGGTDAADALADFSNYGATTVDLAAPADDVLTLTTAESVPSGLPTYGWTGGTSLSTPLVAGTAQLLLAIEPDLALAELRNALENTGDPVSALAGKTVTGKRLDSARALRFVAGPPPGGDAAIPSPPTVTASVPEPAVDASQVGVSSDVVHQSAPAALGPTAAPRAAPAAPKMVAKRKVATKRKPVKKRKVAKRKTKRKRKTRRR
jgi:hypothetical protein